MVATISSLHNPYLPMFRYMNMACNAEINHLATDITISVLKLIAFVLSINMKYKN